MNDLKQDAILPVELVINASTEQWRERFGGKILRFDDLTKCGDEVWIGHDGQLYRLSTTRLGKLVLTKSS